MGIGDVNVSTRGDSELKVNVLEGRDVSTVGGWSYVYDTANRIPSLKVTLPPTSTFLATCNNHTICYGTHLAYPPCKYHAMTHYTMYHVLHTINCLIYLPTTE